MERYKLIGDYPKREKGDIAYYDPEFRDTNFIWEKDRVSIPEDLQPDLNPDLFKKVGKDYEILEFKDVRSFCPNYDRRFWIKVGEDKYDMIGSNLGGLNAKDLLVKGNSVRTGDFIVNKIKRLSDGEVFTVGDRVALEEKWEEGTPCILDEIKISKKDTIKFVVKEEDTKGTYAMFESFYKVKPKVLFKTEDGVEIFEGDRFVVVDPKNLVIGLPLTAKPHHVDTNRDSLVYFSSTEAAKEYVLLNEKSISVADVIKEFDDGKDSSFIKRFIRIAKENNGIL